MFGVALDKIQSLLSRDFLVAAFLPWLIFVVLNLLMVERVWPALGRPLAWYLDREAGEQALAAAAVVIAVAVVAFAASPLAPALRAVLEGRLLMPEWVAGRLRHRQRTTLATLNAEINGLRRLERGLRRERSGIEQRLGQARAHGEARAERRDAASVASARAAIDRLWAAPDEPAALRACLDAALERTVAALERNPASSADEVDQTHQDVLAAIDILFARITKQVIRLYTRRQQRFPRDDLAPTSMGNAAAAVRSYALSRYNLSLDFFWPRLEIVVPVDSSAQRTIQESKIRLDFVVLLLFLTGAFTLWWLGILLLVGIELAPFLMVGIAGPLIVRVWYALALESYLAFGEAMRSAVDLHRLDLLHALHQGRPRTSAGEQRAWEALRRRLDYGEPVVLHYSVPEER
jgi:hypothetical protein